VDYPTDVPEPRFGTDAFEENDPASQLAQAAFLLLVGEELRQRRGAMKGAGASPRAALPRDAAPFQIPAIPAEGRRYLPPKLPRDARDLHEISRDLAVTLQQEPREWLAADLLHVCAARPDPIVRAAAAFAAFDVSAEPARLVAILAHATRDEDALVRDVAATALARIAPRHPALGRLTSGSPPAATPQEAHTSMLVHGTFARNQTWWQPGGDFHGYILNNVLPDLYAQPDRFEWSGGYDDVSRVSAGQALKQWCDDHSVTGPLLMGHSHGANVIFIATTYGLAIEKVVALSCPVRWPQYLPVFTQIAQPIVSIRVKLDLVILVDGGAQEFTDPRVREHVLPVWFNHSASHDPAIWQKYDVPSML
jgi:hypothetical protein